MVARVSGPRHLAVHARTFCLPPRGDAAHPDWDRLFRVPQLGTFGLWRSLVARVVRDDEAAGSNPVSPTM
ncbi:hypothetical protein AERO9AM_20026 [Aeromicrobium sp. 9AM]|nr:hypothetical protein AERO9AM_20026 [Aeromicrobium sp. 9AM]